MARGMPASSSSAAARTDRATFFWRWHYRALTVQRLLREHIGCWVDRAYGGGGAVDTDAAMARDEQLQAWYSELKARLPCLGRAARQHPEWAPAVLTREGLVNVVSTMMVWLSWIHEDVGHAAAAYVYSPIHTPMMVPRDGVGVPLRPYVFNTVAYRGFVFLERAALLDDPPAHWFDAAAGDRECFTSLQDALRTLGETDPSFSECERTGFYTCVHRIETAVSS